jgi:hypothetical protein
MRGGAGLLRMMAAGAGAQAAALKGVSLELTGVPQARLVSFPTRRVTTGWELSPLLLLKPRLSRGFSLPGANP